MAKARRDPGLIALIAAFAILAAATIGTFFLFRSQQEAQARVARTLEVEEQLSLVLSHLQDAETGQRGFLVTGEARYLQPYHEGTQALPAIWRGSGGS